MRENDISEAETARRLKVAQSALNRITNQGLPPTLRTAAKLVEGFSGQLTYDDLLDTESRQAARKVRGKAVAS